MSNDHRPWFGPKRVGYGLRPQTWQAWTILVALVALIIAVTMLLAHDLPRARSPVLVAAAKKRVPAATCSTAPSA